MKQDGQPPAHAAAMRALVDPPKRRGPKKTWDIIASDRARNLLISHPLSNLELQRRGAACKETVRNLRAGDTVHESCALRICKALMEAANATPL